MQKQTTEILKDIAFFNDKIKSKWVSYQKINNEYKELLDEMLKQKREWEKDIYREIEEAEKEKTNLIIKFSNPLRKRGISINRISELLQIKPQIVFKILEYGNATITKHNRIKTKKRDAGKCRFCKTSKNLQLHHIFKANRHTPKNLLTLCSKCHTKIEEVKRNDKEKYSEIIMPYYKAN